MADLKEFAEQLVNLTVKEVNELADILKDEDGIEPAAAAVAVAGGAAAGGGTSEAAIATGGNYRNCDTEEWNGTNWSEVNHHILDHNCFRLSYF